MQQIIAHWKEQIRPVETDLSVNPAGVLRFRWMERWIECNARDFLLAALAGVYSPKPPRGPMQGWAQAVKDLLPGNGIVEFTSRNTAGDTAAVIVGGGTVAIEDMIAAELKQVCKAIALELWNSKQEKELVDTIKKVWWA